MTDINALAAQIHEISTSKGFSQPNISNLPEKLMLSVSELAEAMEEHRREKGLVYYVGESLDGPSKPEGILVEIGDSIIRNLHMMHSLIQEAQAKGSLQDLEVSDILNLKVGYNASRPYLHGEGKTY